MPHLLEAQSRGYAVRTLDERPRIPPHLQIALVAARDLAGDRTEQGFPLVAVARWCELVGKVDPFWLALRLRALIETSGVTADG